MRARALPALLLAAACAGAPEPAEEIPANREDVAAALYRQLDEVLARLKDIRGDDEPEAEVEREQLDRLAHDICIRIVRVDPDADPDTLVRKLEDAR